jgi:hypothetical protein
MQKVASFFVNGASLLQMSLKVIQGPLPTALGGNQYRLAPLTNICLFKCCLISERKRQQPGKWDERIWKLYSILGLINLKDNQNQY